MEEKNKLPEPRIERDDNLLDMLSQGYLGVALSFAPIILMFLGLSYRFIYEPIATVFPNHKVFILLILLSVYSGVSYLLFWLFYKRHCDEPSNELCANCVKTNVLDLILMQYGLITAVRLEKIEKELEKGDEVLIYTCSLATEPLDVVRYNVKRKNIKYDVFYYDGKFKKQDEWLYRTNTPLTISEHGFDSKLARSHTKSNRIGCGFDLFIVKRKGGNEATDIFEGYYAVNYSTENKYCQIKADGKCHVDLQCDPNNDKLFYRRIDEGVTESIYYQLVSKRKAKSPLVRFIERLKGIRKEKL